MNLFDSHSHLNFPGFDADREAILARMAEKGIGTVTIGTTLGSSKSAIEFAEQHENIWASVGYHPEHFTSDFVMAGEEDKGEYSIEKLRALATSSKKVVAIGETGLDFYRIDEGRDVDAAKQKQEAGFRDQLALARELDLALVVHCRDAFPALIRILMDEQTKGDLPRTVIHCFSGTWVDAQLLLDLGCYLSFAGTITFPAKKDQDPETMPQRVVERMPLDRMLIETDAPFLTPVPHRGKQNEPTYVEFVAEKVAELRKMEVDEIAKVTTENAKRVFKL